MAEDPIDTEAEEVEGGDTEAQKSGGSSWIKMLAIGMPMLGLAAGMAVLCASFLASDSAAEGSDPAQTKEKLEDISGKQIHDETDIVVNLSDDRLRRFLKASVHLELASEETMEYLAQDYNRMRVRDTLITLLSSKKLADIEAPDSKAHMRREIREALNALLNVEDSVVRVYFTDFQVQ